MTRNDFKVGQKVYFGRRHGEKTLGVIEKLNPTKAKVKTLEERGNGRASGAGVGLGVPYSLMRHADSNDTPTPAPREKLTYSPFDEDTPILEAILGVYANLSPENLTADGEASPSYVRQRLGELNRKLKALQTALGRDVSEGEIYEWNRDRLNYDRQQRA